MGTRPRLSDETTNRLEQICDEYGYAGIDGAVRHLLRERDADD